MIIKLNLNEINNFATTRWVQAEAGVIQNGLVPAGGHPGGASARTDLAWLGAGSA
jgi:hypothetical protein